MSQSPKWVVSVDGSTVDRALHRPRDLTLGGVAHPAAIFRIWTVAKLREIGVYPVQPATAPEGHRILSRSFERAGDGFAERLTTEAAPMATDAERAATLTLTAVQFFDALAAEPLIDRSQMGVDVKAWLRGLITAATLPAEVKIAALNRLESAVRYPRTDPSAPGMLEAIGAILPRADGGSGGLTSAEIDALFIRVAGALEAAS